MESTKQCFPRIASRAWGPILGAFIAAVVLFHTSEQVGNFFDVNRYFVAEVFLPAWVTLAGIAILRHFRDRDWIRYIFVAFTVAVSLWFAGLGLQFASANPEGPMWVHGYLMDYDPALYMMVWVGLWNLLFLSTLDLVGNLRNQFPAGSEAGSIIALLCKKMLGAFLFALILLLAAQYVAVGAFYLILPVGIALPFLLPANTPLPLADRDQLPANTSRMNRRKAFIIGLGVVVALALLGFLWPVQYLRLLPDPSNPTSYDWIYYLFNPRLVLEDALLTIAVAIILLALILVVLRMIKANARNRENLSWLNRLHAEKVLLVCLCASILMDWVWYSAGITIGGLRPANVLTPAWIIFGFLWVISRAARQQPSPAGMLSALFVFGSMMFWLGFILGIGAGSGYPWVYLSVAFALAVVLLVFGSFLPDVRKVRQQPSAATSPATDLEGGTEIGIPERVPVVPRASRHARTIRAIAVIALIAMPVGLFYAGSVQSLTNFRVLANVDNNCIFYLADPFNRVDQNYQPGFGGAVQYEVDNVIQTYAARSEWESVQIVMLPINQKHFSLYDIYFSGFMNDQANFLLTADAAKFQAYVVQYVDALADKVPDILVPFSPLAVSDGKNHPLWFSFYVPPGSPAGDYNGTITLTVDEMYGGYSSPQNVTLNIYLHVWDFRLPIQPTLASNFGLSTPENSARFNATMQVFEDHRMMKWVFAPMPPFNITTAGAVDFVNYTAMDACYNLYHSWQTHTFGVTFSPASLLLDAEFTIDGINYTATNFTSCPKYDTILAQYWSLVEAHLKSMSFVDDLGQTITWYSETYYEGVDEVDSAPPAVLASTIAYYEWLKDNLSMTIPIMQTMGENADLEKVVNIICHHGSGTEPAFLHAWQASGKEAWLYTTRGPRFPNPSIQTANFGLQCRALGWQTFIFNYTHYLIWDVQTPINTDDGFGYQGWNGGTLLYQAPNDGFYLSTRIELLRDGFEDHDYFTLLQDSVQAINAISPGDPRVTQGVALLQRIDNLMNGYIPTMDYRAFEQLEVDIGTFLSSNCILR